MALNGYRNLGELMGRMLPAEMGEASDYETDVARIGEGVAAWFDRVTGRKLRRDTAAVFECPGGVDSVVLTSYPVETVATVTLAGDAVTDYYLQNASGILDFGESLGCHRDRLVVTSSGGYWCQDRETDTVPEGAVALPDDLLQAWFAQCRAACDAEGIFRQKGAGNFSDKDKREPAMRLDTMDLLPSVRRVLTLYTRYP